MRQLRRFRQEWVLTDQEVQFLQRLLHTGAARQRRERVLANDV